MSDFSSCICSFVPDSVRQIPFEFVKRQFIYFFRHERRASDLKEEIKKLKGIVDTMKREVEAARRNGEVVLENVREWLASVDGVISEEKAKELESARERAKARCFVGLCPNLWSRRQLCKMAIAEAATVASFLKDYPDAPMFHGRVACRPALQGMIGDTLDEDNMNFESRANTFEGIIKALKDPSVPRVGVYGMGGVGKTTLVKQIQRKAREENIFDEIALTTVTTEPNTKRIQEEIADALGLKFKAETVANRATELIHRLNNVKSILIILDDIWEELSLPDIGISFKDFQIVDGNKMPRCKILMTSRDEGVLRVMKSTSASNFEVGLLTFSEAESLFTKIVGVPRGEDYKSITTEVVEKCARLPIAIVVVAKALLANPRMDVWQDVRNKLERSMANNSVVKHVHETLKLSYEMLKEEEAKPLFLLLGMFPQGASIPAEILLRYGVGLGLFDGAETYQESRISVNALLSKLRDSSLLQKGDYNDTVKLHDLVRDVAANIASSDPYNMFRIEGKSDFKRLSKNGKLSHATGLFILPGSELPEVLECPKLQFLHIRHKEESFIYDRLFEQTKELKVLDLTSMAELKSLPASLLSLTSLQSLCLDDCSGIRDISNIGKLQHLLVLRIRGSGIEELPEDLKQLRELQLLDLSDCSKLKVIPENLFSSLTKLEELYMGKSFNQWGVEGNASLSELLNLSSLTVLHIHIPQAEMIPEGMPFEKLTAYNIVIGDQGVWLWHCNYEKSGKLMIVNPGVSIHQIPNAKKLLASTEELSLCRLKGDRNVLYELDSHGFLHLKKLVVLFSSLQYLVNFEGNRFSNAKAFPDLESLRIMYSGDLQMVCHGQPKAEALMGLRSIDISGCDALTRLFPLSMAKYLLQLEKIEVKDCENLITIFDMGMVDSNEASETTGGIELSKLRSLKLIRLPQFVGFCTQDQQMQPLFNERILLPHTLDTMPSRMSHGLVNLTSLIIVECGHLKYLFSFSVVRTLKQLQWLQVTGCESMEMIVLGEETNLGSEFGAKLSFPQLKFLQLHCMKNLIEFCSKNYDVDFPSLESLGVSDCYLLEPFFSTNNTTLQPHNDDKILLPHTLDTMPSRMSHGLINLTSLTIGECGHLKYLFSFSVVRTLKQLQRLQVSDCKSMEMIVLGEETNPGSELGVKLSFPQLNNLRLCRMERLRRFCSKNYNVDFPSLEVLEVSECHQLEALSSTHDVDLQPHFNDKILLPHIPDTMLFGLTSLTTLKISKSSWNYLFSVSVVRALEQLRELNVSQCQSMEVIVLGEETNPGNELGVKLSFPRLSKLTLQNMGRLRRFCSKNYNVDFPSLEWLEVRECHQLEALSSPHDVDLQSHFNDKIPLLHMLDTMPSRMSHGLVNLTSLTIDECGHLKYLFSFSVVRTLKQLQRLQVSDCKSMEMIVLGEETNPGSELGVKLSLPQLNNLRLCRMERLRRFCSKNYNVDFPSLEVLEVSECHQLEALSSTHDVDLQPHFNDKAYFTQIWNRILKDIAKFKCLKHLNFRSFDNLEYLFNHSMAFDLVLLEVLCVGSCKMMKEIITEEITTPNQNETVILPRLKELRILDCPNLINFCAGKQALKFPSLEQLIINKCPNVLSFYSTSTEREGGPSNCTSPSFFSDKVALPSLSRLEMADFDNVVTIFSSNIVHKFLGIQKLDIRNCAALEMVYEMQGLSAKEHSANGVAQLRDLTIKDLPKLRCIWSEDPQGVAFQNLSEVVEWGCENLRYLFPPSVAQGLSQLKKLMICHCGVEEVVAMDKDEQQVMRFAFPQLRKFILLALPKLKFFYAGQHTIEWPMFSFAAQSDNIEGLSKVLPNAPMQSIERDTGFSDLRGM